MAAEEPWLMQKLCSPHGVITLLLAVIFIISLAQGAGKLIVALLQALLKKMKPEGHGQQIVNIGGGGGMSADKRDSHQCDSCSDHSMVMEFISDTKEERTDLYRKVNRANLKLAKIEVMMEMLLKARGIEIDFSKVDLKLDEDAEG